MKWAGAAGSLEHLKSSRPYPTGTQPRAVDLSPWSCPGNPGHPLSLGARGRPGQQPVPPLLQGARRPRRVLSGLRRRGPASGLHACQVRSSCPLPGAGRRPRARALDQRPECRQRRLPAGARAAGVRLPGRCFPRASSDGRGPGLPSRASRARVPGAPRDGGGPAPGRGVLRGLERTRPRGGELGRRGRAKGGGGGGSRGSAPLAAGPGGRKGPASAAPPRGRQSLSPGARSADKCSAAARPAALRGPERAEPCSTRTPGRRAPWGCRCTRPRRCCSPRTRRPSTSRTSWAAGPPPPAPRPRCRPPTPPSPASCPPTGPRCTSPRRSTQPSRTTRPPRWPPPTDPAASGALSTPSRGR